MVKDALHEKKEFSSYKNLVEEAAVLYKDKVAYSYRIKPTDKEIQKVTFEQMRDDVRALTTEFLSRGYSGKHCPVIGKFSYEWVCTYFSLIIAGAVIVPLDKDWLASDLADTALKAEASVVFADADMLEKANAVCEAAGVAEPIILSGDIEREHQSSYRDG